MSTLLFGAVSDGYVPPDESVVRMTTAPVTPDAPPAMADDAPEPNEVETDSNPMLGLATRQVASKWHDGEQYRPSWIEEVDSQTEHNAIVDRQVSTSGTAAQREAAGVFGHGTLKFAEGIEPVGDLTPGGAFGNEYFITHDRPVQDTAGDYMTLAPGTDQDTSTMVASAGKAAARDATAAAYQTMWRGLQA